MSLLPFFLTCLSHSINERFITYCYIWHEFINYCCIKLSLLTLEFQFEPKLSWCFWRSVFHIPAFSCLCQIIYIFHHKTAEFKHSFLLSITSLMNAIKVINRTPWIIAQCWSMSIDTDKKMCYWSQCWSMSINTDQLF